MSGTDMTSGVLSYLIYAGTALLVYDDLLTMSDEVRHVWRPRKSLVFGLFMSLRYTTLASQVLLGISTAGQFPASIASCIPGTYVQLGVNLVASTALSGTFVLRSFAIWNRNWAILLSLGTVTLAKVLSTALVSFKYTRPVSGFQVISTSPICTGTGAPISDTLGTTINALVILFDTLVLLLTITKTLRTALAARRFHFNRGYSFFILRDGILYFIAVDVIVIATVIVSQVSSSSLLIVILQNVQHPLSSIWVQRLILNLRHESYSELHPSENSMELRSMQFAKGSVIGHIGAPLCATSADNVTTDDLQDGEETAIYARRC